MDILKRDNSTAKFDLMKVKIAVGKANFEKNYLITQKEINDIAAKVKTKVFSGITVDQIQEIVILEIEKVNKELARSYRDYTLERELIREGNTTDAPILSLVQGLNSDLQSENSNKNPVLNSTQRDLIAGEVSKDFVSRMMYDKDIIKAHEDAIIHIHDRDYLFQPMTNCCLVNLEDMLQNNTLINGNLIERPKSFQTACTIATQITAQVASSQYGGQTFTLSHISPFIDISRKKFKSQLIADMIESGIDYDKDMIDSMINKIIEREVKSGVQTIQYQLETLSSTNGQSPFVSINMDLGEVEQGQTREDLAMLIEEILNQRIKGIKNKNGVYVAPSFPKLLYVLDEGVNAKPEDPYYYLTKLSAECSAKRLVPDYISAKKMREYKDGNVYPCMGCRSFLTSGYKDENGEYKFYGRFNWGVVSINLVDAALSSEGSVERLWEILDERLEIIKRAHLIRYDYLKNTKSDVSPILWQDGAIARLKPGETIGHLLVGGYSTVSLGYAGLYEAVVAMIGESHTTEKGEKLGLSILEKLNDTAAKWKEEYNMDFSVYGSPIESTTERFAKGLQKRFGVVEGITDKNYITNSYHIHVEEEIDAFSKLSFEAKFQELSPGGAISYIEMPNMKKNIPAVLAIIDHIYENIMYAELNTKADVCLECNYEGEILIDDNYEWYCPECGNRDQNTMQVTRRTCGYVGSHYWGKGRTQEIANRVLHIGND